MEIVFVKKVIYEYDVKLWCCNAFENLVKENKVIFFDKETCQFKDLKDNIFFVCPYCGSNLDPFNTRIVTE
jgi:hypothetical protein